MDPLSYNLIEVEFAIASSVIVSLNFLISIWNAIIFSQKTFQKTSTGYYLFVLSFTDMITPFVLIGNMLHNYQIFERPGPWCAIGRYIIYSADMFSPWILVLVAIDRAISIKYPSLSQKITKRKTQRIIIAVTFFILLLPAIPWLCVELGKCLGDQCFCFFHPVNLADFNLVLASIAVLLKAILPFILMLTANIISGKTMYASKKKLRMKISKGLKSYVATSVILSILSFLFMFFSSMIMFIYTLLSSIAYFNLSKGSEFEPIYQMYLGSAFNMIYYWYWSILALNIFPIIQFISYFAFNPQYRRRCVWTIKRLFCAGPYRLQIKWVNNGKNSLRNLVNQSEIVRLLKSTESIKIETEIRNALRSINNMVKKLDETQAELLVAVIDSNKKMLIKKKN